MEINKIIEDVCSKYEQDRYALYLRKSRADMEMEALGEGETLARHLHMLEALAAKHGISTNQITVYKEVVSGESLQDRPEAQKLLADVHARKYKGVLVVEIERLARGNTKDQGEVAEAFQLSDTKIITPSKVYDPNDEFDQEYFEFGLFMSRREYKTIKRRIDAGKASSAAEGNYLLPQRIFGYNIERRSKKERVLVPNPEEAPIVQMIFDWFTEERKTTYWIAKKLTQMGVKTTKNRPEWNRGTLTDMLVNQHYIGKIIWNNTKIVKTLDPKTGKLKRKQVKTGSPNIYEGKHEGIISEEQFFKACKLSESSNHAPVKDSFALRNPLAGMLVCAKCKRSMRYMDYERYESFANNESRFQHLTGSVCKVKSLPVTDVMKSFVEALTDMIADCKVKAENASDNSEFFRHQEMIAAMEKELQKQESKKNKLLDSWESDDGIYTKDEFIERKRMYDGTIENLKEKIQEAKLSAPKQIDYAEKVAMLHSLIDCIKDPNLSAQEKNDFLKTFIDRIDYSVIDYGWKKGGKPVLDVFFK